jgi:lipopolysaccharide/colanic/teichoic acid biosynthesis glycosyltransferase
MAEAALKRGYTDTQAHSAALLSEESLRQTVLQQAAIADRTGAPFTYLRFRLPHLSETEQARLPGLLGEAVAMRCRECDAAGWDSEYPVAVGLLLAGTWPEGALSIASEIKTHFLQSVGKQPPASPTAPDVLCELFSSTAPENLKQNSAVACLPMAEICGCTPPKWKRAMDITGALFALALLSPLLAGIALYIRIVSPGPALFTQRRIGFKGRPFRFYKFRTMNVGADTTVHQQYVATLIQEGAAGGNGRAAARPMRKLECDPQIIPFGRVLRSLSLDELPQLLNVLRGDMSLVGPRPALPYEVEAYAPWHNRRFDVLPGMTGLWQVSGKNRLTFNQMIQLDIRYAHTLSFWSDVLILFATLPAIGAQIKDDMFQKEKSP